MNKEFLKFALAKLDSMSNEEIVQGLKDAGLELVESTPASPSPAPYDRDKFKCPGDLHVYSRNGDVNSCMFCPAEWPIEQPSPARSDTLTVEVTQAMLNGTAPARSDTLDAEREAIIANARHIEELRAAFEAAFQRDLWTVHAWMRNNGIVCATQGTPTGMAESAPSGESIASNADAMVILTQGYPAEDVARVVDAHVQRQVTAALARRATAGTAGEEK